MIDIDTENKAAIIFIILAVIALGIWGVALFISSTDVDVIDEYNIESHNLSNYINPAAFGLKEDIEDIWGFYADFMHQYRVYDESGNMQIVPGFTDNANTHIEYTDEKTPSVKYTITHFITGDVERYTIIVPKNGVIIGTTMGR